MTALTLSLAALLSAPLLDRWLRRGRLPAALDGFTATIIGGIVLLHVLPHGLRAVGWPALAALGLGLLLPAGCGRVPGGRGLVRALATLALLAHGLLDGLALASEEAGVGEMLAEAVILHSLPVGLAIWRMGGAELGRPYAAALLGASAITEIVGFFLAIQLPDGAGWWLALTQCLAAGSLLHVVSHSDSEDNLASGLGALLGAIGVGLLAFEHPIPRLIVDEMRAGQALWTMALSAAPALTAGWALSALYRLRGFRSDAVGSIPLALAFLPGLIGWIWALAAIAVALLGGRGAPAASLSAAAREALDRAAPWVLLGFGLAALAEPLLPTTPMQLGPAAVLAGALLGELLTVEAAAAVPILAMMLHKGLPPGPAFALLVAALPGAPGLRRLAKLALAVGLGLALGDAWSIELALHSATRSQGTHLALLAVLTISGVGALLRQGVGGFLDRILHPGGHADHAEHGHAHGG